MLKDFYMEDFLSGCQNTEEVMELINKLTLLMKQGSFNFHKYISNIPGVLRIISQDCSKSTNSLSLNNGREINIFGIQ